MENQKAPQLAVYSQLAFFLMIAVCVLIIPQGLSANAGISYYGAFAKTIVPYTFGLLVSAGFIVKFANSWSRTKPYWPAKFAFYSLAFMTIVASAVPYNLTGFFYGLHSSIVAGLFFLEAGLGAWLVFIVRWDSLNVLSLVLMAIAGVVSGLYLRPTAGLLLQSQLIFQAFFTLILIRSSRVI